MRRLAKKIIWVVNDPAAIQCRSQDSATNIDLAQVLLQLTKVDDALTTATLREVDHVWCIGSANLLRTVQKLRQNELAAHLNPAVKFVASVYGPMQCMLKGVCAQCLQWQIDPVTGQRTKAVYACSWHNQPLEIIDIDNLDQRLGQNHAQERLTNLWLDYLQETAN